MKWRLMAALLVALPMGVMAQEARPDTPVSAATVAARPAFELQIDAPEAIQDLLNAYLDIKRYREVNDLSDNELRRLMQVAQDDSRALMGTAGYFAPDIQAELDIRPTDRLRTVKLTIVPG
jgi:translocation and assembly module TamA